MEFTVSDLRFEKIKKEKRKGDWAPERETWQHTAVLPVSLTTRLCIEFTLGRMNWAWKGGWAQLCFITISRPC